MKRASPYTALLLLPVLMALPFAQMPSADGADPAVRHTIVAASGTAAPAGGNYLTLSFLNATVNARDEIAFDALLAGPPVTPAVFVGDSKTTSTIALGINPDPTQTGLGFVSNPAIMPNGVVVFDVNDGDVFMSDGKTAVPLVRAGDPAPGGGTLTPLGGTRAVNGHAAVAYGALVSDSTATQGIFRTDGKQTVAIARDDMRPPTGGTFTLLSNLSINDQGQVAFIAAMTAGSSGDGLFVGDGQDAVAIALEGQLAPKGGSYRDVRGLGTFRAPFRFNDRGEVAFDARLTGGASTSGVFRGNGARTTTIALAGTAAPGTTGTFDSFDDIALGIDGRVAFIGTLTLGVGGVNASNNKGIWIGTSDDDLQLVVRTGEVIDGKVLTRLPQFGQGHQFEMNENGVLWIGSFGPTKAVVFSRIPDEHQ